MKKKNETKLPRQWPTTDAVHTNGFTVTMQLFTIPVNWVKIFLGNQLMHSPDNSYNDWNANACRLVLRIRNYKLHASSIHPC